MSQFNDTKSPWYPLNSTLTLPTYATCFQLSLQKAQATPSKQSSQLTPIYIGVSHGPLENAIQNIMLKNDEKGDFLRRNEERIHIRWVKTRKPCLTRQKEMVWSGIPQWNTRDNKICEKCGGKRKPTRRLSRASSQNLSLNSSSHNDSSLLHSDAEDSSFHLHTSTRPFIHMKNYPELYKLVTTPQEYNNGQFKPDLDSQSMEFRDWCKQVHDALQKSSTLLPGARSWGGKDTASGSGRGKGSKKNYLRGSPSLNRSGTKTPTKEKAGASSLTAEQMDILIFSRVFPSLSESQREEVFKTLNLQQEETEALCKDFDQFLGVMKSMQDANKEYTSWITRLWLRSLSPLQSDSKEQDSADDASNSRTRATIANIRLAFNHLGHFLSENEIKGIITSLARFLSVTTTSTRRRQQSSSHFTPPNDYNFDDFCRILSRGKSQASQISDERADSYFRHLKTVFEGCDVKPYGFMPKNHAVEFLSTIGIELSAAQIEYHIKRLRKQAAHRNASPSTAEQKSVQSIPSTFSCDGSMFTDLFFTMHEMLLLLTAISKKHDAISRLCNSLESEKKKAFRRLFYRMDADGSGSILISDLLPVLTTEWRYDVDESEVQEMLQQLDYRKNPSRLDFNEFTLLMMKVEDKMDKYLQLFTEEDADGDGMISIESLHLILAKLQIPVTDKWLDRFLKRLPGADLSVDQSSVEDNFGHVLNAVNFEQFISIADMVKRFYFPNTLTLKQKMQFRNAFDQMDSTKDGYIDSKEITIIVQKDCMLDLTQDEVEDILRHFVKPRKRSEISMDEFLDFCHFISEEITAVHERKTHQGTSQSTRTRKGRSFSRTSRGESSLLPGVSPIQKRNDPISSDLREPNGTTTEVYIESERLVASLSSSEVGHSDSRLDNDSGRTPPVDIDTRRSHQSPQSAIKQEGTDHASSAVLNITPPSIPPKHSSPFSSGKSSDTGPQSDQAVNGTTTPVRSNKSDSNMQADMTPKQEKRLRDIFAIWDLDDNELLDVHELSIGFKHRVSEDHLLHVIHQINKKLGRIEIFQDRQGNKMEMVKEDLDFEGFVSMMLAFKERM